MKVLTTPGYHLTLSNVRNVERGEAIPGDQTPMLSIQKDAIRHSEPLKYEAFTKRPSRNKRR